MNGHGLHCSPMIHVIYSICSRLVKMKVFAVDALYTVLPAKSDSDVMFCFQSYQGLIIDESLVY